MSLGIRKIKIKTTVLCHYTTIRVASTKISEGRLGGSVIKCPTSAQVMISQSMSLSPVLGSVLTARRLESALDPVSPSLCSSPFGTVSLSLSLSLSLKNKKTLKKKNSENIKF